MAPGTSMMSNLNSPKLKTSLLLLRASSENLQSCRIIFLQESGRVVKSVIVRVIENMTMFGKMSTNSKTDKIII